jgi:serine/threonine/tyrosine-interacting protein
MQAMSGQELSWRYEMRREIQEIIPNVFLGPFYAAKDISKLQQLGITHILIIRDPAESHFIKPLYPQHFIYHIM